jgi:hypothetical protein
MTRLQRLALVAYPSRGCFAVRLAIHQNCIEDDILEKMGQDVLLNDIPAIDVLADLAVDLVPRAADIGIEKATKRAKVLVEGFRVLSVTELNPIAFRRILGFHGAVDKLAITFPGPRKP